MVVNYQCEDVDCCPVCGGEGKFDVSRDDEELGKIVNIQMYSCVDCESVYHNPRMTKEIMEDYYASGVFRETHETSAVHEQNRADRLMAVLGMYDAIQPKRCLDVGSSRGWLLSRIKEKYGAEVVAYDIYSDPDAVIKPVNDKSDIDGKFDLITCIHTLEHFHDPMAELTWMGSMLAEDGYLLFEIPTVRKIMHPHPVIFSKRAVNLLMEHIGFTFDFYDVAKHIRIIVAHRGKDTNSAEFYDTLYLERPSKWAHGEGVKRDTFALSVLKDHIRKPLRMLDFGCGNGHTLNYFQKFLQHGDYTGVDKSEIALRLAKAVVPDGEFYTEMPEGKWNLITVMGTAEHFKDPIVELRDIGDRLAKNGILYLEVPNCLNGTGVAEGYRETRFQNGARGSGQHEWHWERDTWEGVIADAGFEIVEEHQGTSPTWEFIWTLVKE